MLNDSFHLRTCSRVPRNIFYTKVFLHIQLVTPVTILGSCERFYVKYKTMSKVVSGVSHYGSVGVAAECSQGAVRTVAAAGR